MWNLKFDDTVPDLPAPIKIRGKGRRQKLMARSLLKEGCWYVWLAPAFEDEVPHVRSWMLYYLGTVRIEHDPAGTVASGDLYVKRQTWNHGKKLEQAPLPALPPVVPIFPRADYRFYLRLDSLEVVGTKKLQLRAHLATFRFDHSESTWSDAGILVAALEEQPTSARDPYHPPLAGEVRNSRGTPIGRIYLGWVDHYFRRAELEIDRVKDVVPPLNNGSGLTFEQVFREVKWQLQVATKSDIAEGLDDNEVFPESELHPTMLRCRDENALDELWRYHLLIVRRFRERRVWAFGMMYDDGSLDSNLVPREGAVIAAHARFPDDVRFGTARDKRLQDVAPAYFRASVHELAHCMGLMHTYSSPGFQNATSLLKTEPGVDFPEGISYLFDPEDARRLKHFPDPWVRPGGSPIAYRYSWVSAPTEDLTTDGSSQFRLEVRPVLRRLPLGAPLRLYLHLENISKEELPGPGSLAMEAGTVAGVLRGPGGEHRFATAKRLSRYAEESPPLRPAAVLDGSLTLLRGPAGPLLPTPGLYAIEVSVVWLGMGGLVQVRGESSVLVTEPDEADVALALDLLASREISIPLVFRTPLHHRKGSGAAGIHTALEMLKRAAEDEALGPHFFMVQALWKAEQGKKGLLECLQSLRSLATGDGWEKRWIYSSGEIAKILDLFDRELPSNDSEGVQGGLEALLQMATLLEGASLASPTLAKRIRELLWLPRNAGAQCPRPNR